MKVNKKNYQDLLDCIQSDQVSAPEIAEYFEDKDFHKFYKKNQELEYENLRMDHMGHEVLENPPSLRKVHH